MIFYYLLIIRLVNLMTPVLVAGGTLLVLWLVLLAGKQFVRETVIDGIEIYSRINTARQDKRERDVRFEIGRQKARLRLIDNRRALKAGLPLTVSERFASGEFDVEIG